MFNLRNKTILKAVSSTVLLATGLFANAAPEWESQHPGAGGQHQCVVTDPSVEGRVYICIDMNGIFRSDDSGESWKNYYTDAASGFAFHLAIDPNNSDIIYSGNFWGVDISTNGGDNWTTPTLPVPESLDSGGGDAVAWLTIDPNDTKNVFAAPGWRVKDNEKRNKDIIWPLQPHDGVRNIYVSNDYGATWQSEIYEAQDGYRQIYSTAVHPTTSELYIGAHSGIYKRNAANDYTRLPVPEGAVDGLSTLTRKLGGNRGVTISPDGQWLYALWSTDVFYSDNGKSEVATELFAFNLTTQQWTHIDATGKRPAEYANPIIDPRSTASEHKILLPHSYDGPSSGQAEGGNVGRTGLWEYTVQVANDQVLTTNVDLIGDGDGVGEFNYEAGWEHREWKLRGGDYSSTKWQTRSIFASGGQQLYRANTEEPGYPHTAWTDIYSKKVENGRYTNRGYAATVNFDATAYGNYAVQNLADLGVFDSFDGGKSWEEIVVWAQSSHSSEIVTAEGETPLSIIHLNRGFGNTAGNKGGLYIKPLSADLSSSVYTQLAGVNMKYIQVTPTGAIRLRGLPNLVYKDLAYDPSNRSLYVATRSGPNAGIYRALDIFKMANETEETEDKYRNFFKISGSNQALIIGKTINRLFVDPNNHNRLWIQLEGGAIVKATNDNGWHFTQTPLVDNQGYASTSNDVNSARDMYVWNNEGQTYVAVIRGNDVLVSPNAGESFHYLGSASDVSPGVNPGWLDGPGTLDLASWVAGYGNRIYFGLSNYTHRRSGGFYEYELHSSGTNVVQTTNITGDPKSEGYWARSTRASVVDNVVDEGAFLLVPTRGSGLLRYKIGTGNIAAPEIDVAFNQGRVLSGAEVELGTILKGMSKTLTLDISNLGNAPLELAGSNAISVQGGISDDFIVSATSTESITSQASTSTTIEFTPSQIGRHEVQINVANNDLSESDFSFTVSITVLDPFATTTLSEQLASNGQVTTPYTGDDKGHRNSGIRLVSLGFEVDSEGNKTASVWRIRNSKDESRTVIIESVTGNFEQEVNVQGNSELTILSPIVQGAAVHKLKEIDTSRQKFYQRLVSRFPWLAAKLEQWFKYRILDVENVSSETFDGSVLVPRAQSNNINMPIAGDSTLTPQQYVISGSGSGFNSNADQLNFVFDPTAGDISLLGAILAPNSNGQYGLMIREDQSDSSKAVFVGVSGGSNLVFSRRSESGSQVEVLRSIEVSGPVYLRLDRKVNFFTASYSLDGIHYMTLGTTLVVMPFEAAAGFTAASLEASSATEVKFDQIGQIQHPGNTPEADADVLEPLTLSSFEVGSVIDFGNIPINRDPSQKSFVINNIGTDALVLHGESLVVLDQTDAFNVTSQPLKSVVEVGGETAFLVDFLPQQKGPFSATLSFDSNDPDESPYFVFVQGFGQRPVPLDGLYAFDNFESGNLSGGQSWNNSEWTITIDNERFMPEVISTHGPESGDYHLRIPRSASVIRNIDLSGGENLALQFNWKGASLDLKTSDGGLVQINNGNGFKTVFKIDSDDPMTEYKDEVIDLSSFDFGRSGDVALRLIGTNNGGNEYLFFDNIQVTNAVADIDVVTELNELKSGDTVDFGAAEANVATSELTLSLQSKGNLDLRFDSSSAFRIEGPDAAVFSITNSERLTELESGQQFDLNLEFKPTRAGSLNATLVIESNDPNEGVYTVQLVGIGFVSGVVLDASDDFESNDFSGGEGWLDDAWSLYIDNTRFEPISVATDGADPDNLVEILLPRSASIERRVNTLDASNPTLSFEWRSENWNDKGNDGLIVEVFDGVQFITVFEKHLDEASATNQSVNIQLNDFGVLPAADLLVRFKGTCNGGNERSYLDNISVK